MRRDRRWSANDSGDSRGRPDTSSHSGSCPARCRASKAPAAYATRTSRTGRRSLARFAKMTAAPSSRASWSRAGCGQLFSNSPHRCTVSQEGRSSSRGSSTGEYSCASTSRALLPSRFPSRVAGRGRRRLADHAHVTAVRRPREARQRFVSGSALRGVSHPRAGLGPMDVTLSSYPARGPSGPSHRRTGGGRGCASPTS